jgi:tetratricopeptide (TPR) repeat protein
MELLDRLTEKEKLLIQARIERFRGNHNESIIKYGAYLRKYPDSPGEWFSLGYSYMMLSRYSEAIEAFRTFMSIFDEKDPNAFINIASCYRRMKNYPEAIEYYQNAFGMKPALLKVKNLNREFGFAFVEIGDYDQAFEVFEKMMTGDDEEKASGLRTKAMLYMYLGKYIMAEPIMKESTLIFKTLKHSISEFRNYIFLAMMHQSAENFDELQTDLSNAKRLIENTSMSPGWLYYYGKIVVRIEDLPEAEKILEMISERINKGNRWDEGTFNILSGEIELLRGNIQEAENYLKTGHNLLNNASSLESLANFYFEIEEYEMSIPLYKELIELKSLGWEAQSYYVEAHYQLGRIYEIQGNNELAIKYYQSFLDIWREADNNVPMLKEVQSSLSKLSA